MLGANRALEEMGEETFIRYNLQQYKDGTAVSYIRENESSQDYFINKPLHSVSQGGEYDAKGISLIRQIALDTLGKDAVQ